ncbi:hypothetical protein LCGC14_2948240, partial [marine sediment metagenome]
MTEKGKVEGKVSRITAWKTGKGYFLNIDGNSNDFYGFGSCKGEVGCFVELEVSEGTGNFSDKIRIDKLYSKQTVKEVRKELVEDPGVDWIPLLPGATSITVFFLRYFLIERKKKRSPKEIFLGDHILFETIEELINNEIPYMQLGTPGRTEVFKALLCEQLETFRDNLKAFIEENLEFESSAEYRKKLKQTIYDIVEDCEHEWQARQIPQIIIDKYNHFFRDRIDLLLSDITTSSLRYAGRPEKA